MKHIALIAALLLPAAAVAQQQQASPELTALAVTQWVASVAQDNARLRDMVTSLQAENAKLKEPKPAPTEAPK